MNDSTNAPGPPHRHAGLLMNLSFREREVLILRLGLFSGDPPRSVEEVGAIFKISKARVTEIELGALGKLKKLLGHAET